MQHLILTIVLLFSSIFLMKAQENNGNLEGKTVTVKVVNALNNNGNVKFALYNKENFMKQPLNSKASAIDNGISAVVFENLEEGEYAIICFHDENENGRMDFQENGMPKENYGTSNNVMNFGPPDFESSKFELMDEDVTLEIKF